MNRRDFLRDSAAFGTLMATARNAWAAPNAGRVKPNLRFGYAAITWGGNDPQAIEDIAALGFTGIQLRDSAVARWGSRPDELKSLLASRRLTLVALSSGTVPLAPDTWDASLALHVNHAQFVQQVGGLYLQVIDERPAGRAATADDYRRMGSLLTELGKRTADLGITLGLHNHMGGLSEKPDELTRVLDASDPRFVKFELDIAHFVQAGGSPVEAIRTHADRLLFLHIKDLESPVPGGSPGSYRFVELGRGKVDVAGVFSALEAAKFAGWAVVELDEVPDKARTPKEAAQLSKAYLGKIGLRVDGR